MNLLGAAKLKKTKVKPKRKEESIQIAVCKHIKLKYPDAIFNCDLTSGMKLPIWIAAKAKAQRSSRGQPDLVILEPRGPFSGLCLELKKSYGDVYLSDGTISQAKSNTHVLEQEAMLLRLKYKGYYADFGLGLDDCIKKIDTYFALT